MQAFRNPPRGPENRQHGIDAPLPHEAVHHAVAPQQERAPVVAHVVTHHADVGKAADAPSRGVHGRREHHREAVIHVGTQQAADAVGHLQGAAPLQVRGVDEDVHEERMDRTAGRRPAAL